MQQIFRGIQNRPGEAILQRPPEQRHLRRLQDREVDPLGLDMQVRAHGPERLGGERRRKRRRGVRRHNRPDEEGGDGDVRDPDDERDGQDLQERLLDHLPHIEAGRRHEDHPR